MTEDEIRKVSIAASIAVTSGVARSLASGSRRTFPEFLQGLFLAGFVGALTALALESTPYSEATKGFVIGLASFAGEDLLLGILKFTRAFAKHPERYLSRWFR